jgi:hypothetical protein
MSAYLAPVSTQLMFVQVVSIKIFRSACSTTFTSGPRNSAIASTKRRKC